MDATTSELLPGIHLPGVDMLELMPDPVLLRRIDDDTVLGANRAFSEMVGRPLRDLVGRRLEDLDVALEAEDPDAFWSELASEGRARGYRFRMERRGSGGDAAGRDGEEEPEKAGEVFVVSSKVVERLDPGCVLMVARDITARERARRRDERSERLYRQLFDRNVAGTFRTSLDGEILECNQAFAEMFGYDSPDELVGRSAAELYASPRDRSQWIERLREEGHLSDVELELERASGESIWVIENSFLLDDPEGRTTNVGTLVDITDRKELEERLERQAHHDSLTGLANRRLLREKAEEVLARADRRGERAGLLFVDVVRFERVNDMLGHSGGDEVLTRAAQRLEGCSRAGEPVARVGGDEFAVLLTDVDGMDDARAAARRFQEGFEEPVTVEGFSIHLDLGIGAALYPDHASNFSELLACAGQALHRADAPDRRSDGVQSPVQEGSPPELAQETELRRALAEEELELRYQPVYGVADGELAGAEALVRWDHPEAGLRSAAEFVPLAERAGLIREIDRWVLQEAVRQLARWSDRGTGPGWTSVNLSAATLTQEGLVEYVSQLLDAAGVSGDRLVVELTERVAMRDPERVSTMLDRLRDRGVRVAIDDFGTGHAVLAYLKQFHADFLKLDIVFVQRLGDSLRDERLVEGVVALGQQLGMTVLAEGIETREQLWRLESMEADLAQGYLLGRPVPAGEIGGAGDGTPGPAG